MAKAAGRPRNFDTNQILDKALGIFWRKGFSNTTTRELESKLSLNQSSLYNSFGSKAQFFDAVLNHYETLASQSLIEPLKQSEDGLRSLHIFFDDLAAWITQDGQAGCLLINLMAEDGGNSEAVTARTRHYRLKVKEALQSALIRAEARSEISPNESDSRALILFGLALGLNIAARGGSSAGELNQLSGAIHKQIKSWAI